MIILLWIRIYDFSPQPRLDNRRHEISIVLLIYSCPEGIYISRKRRFISQDLSSDRNKLGQNELIFDHFGTSLYQHNLLGPQSLQAVTESGAWLVDVNVNVDNLHLGSPVALADCHLTLVFSKNSCRVMYLYSAFSVVIVSKCLVLVIQFFLLESPAPGQLWVQQ